MMMRSLCFHYLLVVFATILALGDGFVVGKLSPRRIISLRASEGGDTSDSTPSPLPRQEASKENDDLDPLIMSLTRNDQLDNTDRKSISAPIFGEVPLDGSLVVLLPALIIGVVGFGMSINIAMNSGDAIVDSLNQLSEDVTAAAVAKTNMAAPLGSGCRGICSDNGSYEGLENFMNSLKK